MHPIFENAAAFFVISGFIAALLIKSDISSGHPQKMKIMCPVWVLSGLWGNWAALYAYFKIGRIPAGNPQMNVQMSSMEGMSMTPARPLWQRVLLSTLHCGAGFQYAAIRPMESLSVFQTAIKALKIDFMSLTAWQIGMYGFMAVVIFGFGGGAAPSKTGWEFWFMMQLAMFCGFAVSYPVNGFLVKYGIKKAM